MSKIFIKIREQRAVLFCLFLIFFGLRLFFVFNAPLRQDEKEFIEVAKSLSFKGNFCNLPLEHPLVNHPLLSVYAIKLGMSLFGDSLFGYRSFSLFAAFLTLVLIYLFLKKTVSNQEAIAGLILLGFNQFHIGSMSLAVDHGLLIFFSILAVWFLSEWILKQKISAMFFAGIALGLGYLTKEVMLGLLLCAVIYSALFLKGKNYLIFKGLLLLLTAFIAIIFCDILWILKHGSSQRLLQKDFIFNLKFNLSGFSLYFSNLISRIKGVDLKNFISWEHPAMDLGSGLILILGTAYGIFKFRDNLSRFMAVVFIFFICSASIFRRSEFYWSEISIIPAVFLTSISVIHFKKCFPYTRYFIFAFIVYGLINSTAFVASSRELYPPGRYNSIVDYDMDLMKWYLKEGRIDDAIKEAEDASIACPYEARIINFLGICYAKKNDFQRARAYFLKALQLKSDYGPAANNLKLIENNLAVGKELRYEQ